MDEFWNDLLYSVCGSDVGNMTGMKKMDVFDFFDYIKNYESGRRNTNAKGRH